MGLPTWGTSVDGQRPRDEIRECSLPVSMPLTRGYQDPHHHPGPPISRHPSTGRYPIKRLNMYGISTTKETLGRTYAQNFQVGDLVRIYRPVPPPGIPKKFHRPWSIDVNRVLRVLSPTTYITQPIDQSTPPTTVHHNSLKLYIGELPVTHNETLSILLDQRPV